MRKRGRVLLWVWSAALAVVLVLWAYSWIACSWLAVRGGGRSFVLLSTKSYIVIQYAQTPDDPGLGPAATRLRWDGGSDTTSSFFPRQDPSTPYAWVGLLSVMTEVPIYVPGYSGFGRARYPARSFYLPYWLVIAVIGAAGGKRVRREIRARLTRHRQSAGLCPACGYDLRATPDRCPECGRAISVDAETTRRSVQSDNCFDAPRDCRENRSHPVCG